MLTTSISRNIDRCKLSPEVLEKIRSHALSQPGSEVCGLILEGDLFYPCENRSVDQENFAIVDVNDIVAASMIAPITHHYHSHVESREFSAIDIKSCRDLLRVPWILHHTPSGEWDYYDPEYKAPLIGRQWRWAYQNCFNLFQDYFAELGIAIDDFYLESPEAWTTGQSVGYVENLAGQGFAMVPSEWPIQDHDVILMWARSRQPNHVGMVVSAKQNQMIHHMAYQLSQLKTFDRSAKNIHSVWRHAKFC